MTDIKDSKNKMLQLQAVFFDFDGVILDSVNVKTQAFAEMFRKYGAEIEKKVVDYHIVNGGVSRFKKFQYYYENFLNKTINEEDIQILGQEFSKLVLEGVLNAPFIGGALETLQQLQQLNIPAFVVSGTPEEELKFIVKKRSIEQFFKEIHGSPRLKHDIVKDIQQRYNIQPSLSLFVGDAMTDYNAAKAADTLFFGIVPDDSNASPFPLYTRTSSTVSFLLNH